MSEGLRGWDTGRDGPSHAGDYHTSFGAFQLHYGGSGIPGMNAMGLGDDFTKQTGMDARDPKTWRAQADFALRRAAKAGWTDWHGAANTGIAKWQGIGTYKGPVPDAAHHLTAPVPAGTSAKAISDADVFAARQRLAAGGNAPAYRALVQNYIGQQNARPASPIGDVGRMDRGGSGGAPVKVEVTKQPLDPARQKLADAMKHHATAAKLVDLMKSGKLAEHLAPWNHHHRPLGLTNAHLSMNDHRRGDTHLTHNPVFNIQGGDTRTAMEQARITAGRGTADMLRSLKTAEV